MRSILLMLIPCGLAAFPAAAQIGARLPVDLPDMVGSIGGTVDDVARPVLRGAEQTVRNAQDMATQRARRIAQYIRANADRVELDDQRLPAVKGEVLMIGSDADAIDVARRMGFAVIETADLDGLGIVYTRFRCPSGTSLANALLILRKALPNTDFTSDQLHFPAGSAAETGAGVAAVARSEPLPRGGTVGIIDGAVAGSMRVAAQRGFAAGAPFASDHASAIASLLAGAGTERIVNADVYGKDPAGGSALSIARAIAWMQAEKVPVVSISLVGPANPLLGKAVAAAQARGAVLVAAVGNDGPAAPPAYPASYPGVIAVTGIDGSGRVLIEAGRATHLDFAAPGADMSALVPGKGRISLRGTSYAAPLVASRIAAQRAGAPSTEQAMQKVAAEALKGKRGIGQGILCNICRSGI